MTLYQSPPSWAHLVPIRSRKRIDRNGIPWRKFFAHKVETKNGKLVRTFTLGERLQSCDESRRKTERSRVYGVGSDGSLRSINRIKATLRRIKATVLLAEIEAREEAFRG